MKLQVKLTFYNAIFQALIVIAIGILLPIIIQRVVYNHIDKRLHARADKMMKIIELGGLDDIIKDQECSFDQYNIFKEEYVSISPLSFMPQNFGKDSIENAERNIENEVVKHRVLSRSFLYDNQLYQIEIGEGLSTVEQLNHTINKFTLWMVVIIVLISALMNMTLVQLLLEPFNRIVTKKLKTIHHPATFVEDRIRTSTYEFSYLDQSINEMMIKIRSAFDIEREFITNVSHELLTPISILQNRIENILSDSSLPHDAAVKIVESQKTLLRLSKVIRALLYISKIENEQFLKNENADLQTVTYEVIDELEDRLLQKDIKVHKEWRNDFEMNKCNKSLIHTMLFNLVSNAIKYNKEKGEIFITGKRIDDYFLLSIKDTGIGISEDHLPHIFDRFKRFRPEDEMSYGLGLPIVRTIANFHHIRIEVSSVLNSGTEFRLFFSDTIS
ncbi:MAG: HAMP domain-containing sensor histidine kinase [Bacteroidetes bacterium]|nr:HAMP domain-containing sensor histidine kinase [Bacteroidota bacterium]